MLFRQLFDHDTYTYTYLIAQDYGQPAFIIDSVDKHIDLYLRLLKEYQLTLAATLDTHVHADHITASGKLRQATQCKIIMGAHSKAQGLDQTLADGEVITIGGMALTALYTPGHTDDSYCYLLADRVFTGDTLFIRGSGRTDFQHGNSVHAYQSITEKLFTLPEATLVYPGHDYNGMTVSTIGEEKQHNPRLQVRSVAEYQQLMDNLNLAKPKLIDVAVPANLQCGLTEGKP
jgi:sulfur dioxygenase